MLFMVFRLFRCGFRLGIDADLLAGLAQTFELHDTIDLCVQGIIITDAYIVARMDFRSALANENVSRQNELTIAALGAQALRMAVAAVTGRTHSLLMSEELKIHSEHLLYLRSLKIIRRLRGYSLWIA